MHAADFISRVYDLCAAVGSFEVINRRFGNCYSAAENVGIAHAYTCLLKTSRTGISPLILQCNWGLMHHPVLRANPHGGSVHIHIAYIQEENLRFSSQS